MDEAARLNTLFSLCMVPKGDAHKVRHARGGKGSAEVTVL